MGIWHFLLRLDRRIVFILVAAAVITPLIIPLGLPIQVTDHARHLYNTIDEIPSRAKPVLISIDYDPSTVPELQPMTLAVLRHCFKRGVPVIMTNMYPTGSGLASDALSTVAAEFPNAVYGKDYAYLGYKPGVSLVMLGIGEDFQGTFPTDGDGKPISEMEVTKNITNYDDIALMVDFTGSAIYESWIMFAYQKYGCKVGAGVTAVMASDAYPFLSTGQLVGLLGGLSGAAEYEKLIGVPADATIGMDAQSIVHILIIVLIIVGNIAYFAIRREELTGSRTAGHERTGGTS
ncbi:MAG: hypothetical protein JW941_07675 [Candidatus Coatesbacteria bacterium]|nr:hypothetical protein [Candidatus Coatesbacteria bacterium]